KESLESSLYHALIQRADLDDIIVETGIDNLMMVPSNVELIGFEVEMMNEKQREEVLKNTISAVNGRYDYVIIDCPPSLSLLTLNALTAADSVLIPLQSEFFALEGLGQLLATIKRIKGSLNPGLKIKGILLTMFDKRTNLARQVVEDAESYFKGMMFQTKIPRNIRLGEAPSYGMPVITYDAASKGAKSYTALAKELLEK
ncbi:MAG: ParA family protein, partial [Desulfobacteraceae bacterium]